MQREHEVAFLKRSADPGDQPFLAGAGIDTAEDLVLPMQPRDSILEAANQLHPIIKLEFEFDPGSRLRLCHARFCHDRLH